MDPGTLAAAKFVWDQLLSKAVDGVFGKVISEGRERRAQRFVRTFVDAVAGDGPADAAAVSAKLDELLRSETCREALFVALRRVALCVSKDTGPRLVALLTARLIRDQRQPTDVEERMLLAAESLSDADFRELLHFLEDIAAAATRTDDVQHHSGWVWRRLHTETDDTNWPRAELDLSAANFAEELGTWALKLRNTGLLMDRVVLRQTRYSEDSERHIDEPGEARQWSWWVVVHEGLLGFTDLIRLAERPMSA